MKYKQETFIAAIKNRDGNTFLNMFDKMFDQSQDKEGLAKEVAQALMSYKLPHAMKFSLKQHLGDSWKSQGLNPEYIEMALDKLLELLDE